MWPRPCKEVKAGKIEYRLDKTNIIHCPIGKVSFGAEKLIENYNALMGAIVKAKPAAAKGQYIKSCVAAATMGPGVKMNTAKLSKAREVPFDPAERRPRFSRHGK